MTGKRDHTHLLIIGDSITLGATEVRGNEIVARVRRSYMDLLCEVIPHLRITSNADVHRTTSDALAVFDAVIDGVHPDAALLMVGGNDADMNWRRFVLTDGRASGSVVPVARYAENLRKLVITLRARGVTPVLTDMPSHSIAQRGKYVADLCGKDVPAMLERSGGQKESDRRLRQYREAVAEVAADMQAPFVPYGAELAQYPIEEVLGVDGVHPNDKAHRVIARSLAPALLGLPRISHHVDLAATAGVAVRV